MKKYNELDMEVVLFANEDDICSSVTGTEAATEPIPQGPNDGDWA